MKQVRRSSDNAAAKSPLAWGRGLKPFKPAMLVSTTASPLAWGRGLKHMPRAASRITLGRPSRGGVD